VSMSTITKKLETTQVQPPISPQGAAIASLLPKQMALLHK